ASNGRRIAAVGAGGGALGRGGIPKRGGEMRRIGRSDLEIFPLGLGGNTFGNTTDREASERVLDAFVEAGGNHVDTADSYSAWVPGNKGGESETIIGEWMRRRRNRSSMIVATKVGAHPEYRGLA